MRFHTTTTLGTALGLLLLAGCGGADTQSAQAATPAAASAQAEPAAASKDIGETNALTALPAGEYVVEKTHAYVTFSYSHGGLSNPILSFRSFDATATVEPDDLAASTLRVTIDPASIDSAVPRFDEHLKSADMFDVAAHPEITFVSTDLDVTGDSGTLTGDLTMKGITKPVTLDVVLNGAGENRDGVPAFGISATGQLDRSEWDLGYAAPFVGTDVDLRIEAEFMMANAE